jgi:integrase/recombinase XerD
MGKMREAMVEEMKLRGLSAATIRAYTYAVQKLGSFHDRPVEKLGAQEIRAFLLHLTEEKKIAGASVNQAICAIKFFYREVLRRPVEIENVHFQRRRRKLPEVLTEAEVVQLIGATKSLKDRVIVMSMYAAGLRLRELIHLQIPDIDSKAMRLRVREAKGGKERNVILSTQLLDALRTYFKAYRPSHWLFYGGAKETQLHPRTVQRLVSDTARQAGIARPITPHTLRHSFATHLLEHGAELRYIQELMGHASYKTTLLYTRISPQALARVISPLDRLVLPPA